MDNVRKHMWMSTAIGESELVTEHSEAVKIESRVVGEMTGVGFNCEDVEQESSLLGYVCDVFFPLVDWERSAGTSSALTMAPLAHHRVSARIVTITSTPPTCCSRKSDANRKQAAKVGRAPLFISRSDARAFL